MLFDCSRPGLFFSCTYSRARERDLLFFNLLEYVLGGIEQLIQGADGDCTESMDAFPKALATLALVRQTARTMAAIPGNIADF